MAKRFQLTLWTPLTFVGLNEKLKACNSPMTVVAFIITPAETHSFTVETLKGQAVVKQLKETVSDIAKRMETRLFEKAAR